MFGFFRYLLAHMVVIGHLWPELTNWTGVYAVFSFYVLSGYLMSLVLTDVYGFSTKGTLRFFSNRALRIFPAYLFVLCIAIVIVFAIPETAKTINWRIQFPRSTGYWLHNLFIFGLYGDNHRLIPPAWSLDVELFFYALMGVLFLRRRVLAHAWFYLSIVFTIYMLISGYDFGQRYYTPQAASLPFSFGAMIFLFRKKIGKIPKWHIPVAMTLFLTNAVLARKIWGDERLVGFYVSLLTGGYVVISLSGIAKERVPPLLQRMDKLMGDLSYPVFLCHWHIAAIVVWVGFAGTVPKGRDLFFTSIVFINLTAYILHMVVVQPIDKIRNTIRKRCLPERA
jgi:peptidoglycan/LPS O-acetylase OafA/YrhL